MTAPITPVGIDLVTPATLSLGASPAAYGASKTAAGAFGAMVMQGLEEVNQREAAADKLVGQFAVDDSIPLHRVMFALEEAQGSVQLMMQVRSRLVEGLQDLMRMQI